MGSPRRTASRAPRRVEGRRQTVRPAPTQRDGRADRACPRRSARASVTEYQPIPLGFSPLDRTLGGGIRTGELMLIGGAQGTGKTTHVAPDRAQHRPERPGERALHLLRARRGIPARSHDGDGVGTRRTRCRRPPTRGARSRTSVARSSGTWLAQGGRDQQRRPARQSAASAGTGAHRALRTGPVPAARHRTRRRPPGNLRRAGRGLPTRAPHRPLVVFVDYLQRVPVVPEPPTEAEKVTNVVAAAQGHGARHWVSRWCAIVAADKEGLKAARLRNHHLRGSSALNYESDVILILNEKYNIVAKVNIEFNPYQAQRFRDWTIVTRREEPRRPRRGRPRVREALRVLVLRPERPPGPGKAHRGAALQRLSVPRRARADQARRSSASRLGLARLAWHG